MMANHPARWKNFGFVSRSLAALALGVCLSAGAYAQEQQTQDTQPKPTYAPQDPDKPPYSHDQPAPAAPRPQAQSVPGTLTVPAETILSIRINEYLSSDRNRIGDQFTAVLENPIVVNGWVGARRGQTPPRQAKEPRQAGPAKGPPQAGID